MNSSFVFFFNLFKKKANHESIWIPPPTVQHTGFMQAFPFPYFWLRNIAFLLLAAVDLFISSTAVCKRSTFRIPNHIPVRNRFTNQSTVVVYSSLCLSLVIFRQSSNFQYYLDHLHFFSTFPLCFLMLTVKGRLVINKLLCGIKDVKLMLDPLKWSEEPLLVLIMLKKYPQTQITTCKY